jgi:hypothetical protein
MIDQPIAPLRAFRNPRFGDVQIGKKCGRPILTMAITENGGAVTRYRLTDPVATMNRKASLDAIANRLQTKTWSAAKLWGHQKQGNLQHLECWEPSGQIFVIGAIFENVDA